MTFITLYEKICLDGDKRIKIAYLLLLRTKESHLFLKVSSAFLESKTFFVISLLKYLLYFCR